MQETDAKIKNAVYKLSTISSSKPMVDEITQGERRNMELICGIPYNCRVLVTDRKPPLTVIIRYLESNGKVTVYGSFKPNPDEKQHEMKVEGVPKKF